MRGPVIYYHRTRPTNRHIQDDIRNVMKDDWDLLAVHASTMHEVVQFWCALVIVKAPPNRTLADMWRELDEGAELFSYVWNVAHISRWSRLRTL